jgi:hypothetical protein
MIETIDMAEKQFTMAELQAMTKPMLKELGESLNIQMKGLTKTEMLNKIIGENDKEEEKLEAVITNPQALSHSKSNVDWQFQLEMKKMELEEKRMQHELEMARINAGNSAGVGLNAQRADTFRIENAAKLLPKLASEHEMDTYLVTFEKIASLQKWPKTQWASVLQTQLRGKGLKVFAELSLADCADYDKFKQALLAAYEL